MFLKLRSRRRSLTQATSIFAGALLLSISPAQLLPVDPAQARLNELLDEIKERAPQENPYFGDAKARALRERIRDPQILKLPGPTLQTLMQLGIEEVELNRMDEGIARLQEGYHLAARLDVPDTIRGSVIASLGFAYLRLAENENCCAHYAPESCIVPLQGRAIHQHRRGSEQAMRYLREVVDLEGADPYLKLKCAWLINVACMTLGEYPAKVPEGMGIPPTAFRSRIRFPHFPNIAGNLGIDRSNLAGGCIVDDFDGDDDLDLITCSWDSAEPMNYFENKGDGTFRDRSIPSGLHEMMGGLNLVHADYDNDGDLDVLVLRGAWLATEGRHPNALLQNQGNGTFIDRTAEAGLGDGHYPTQTAAWADFDLDGDLDLYIGNESGRGLKAPCQLFLNRGDGTFLDVAVKSGVTNDRYTKGVVWGDVDGDRLPDLFVSNLDGPNKLYRNLGDGTFQDIAAKAGVAGPDRSFPTWMWDFDNDGHLDLFVSSYDAHVGDFVLNALGQAHHATSAGHYRGRGDGTFTNDAKPQGLSGPMLPMGCNYGDLNNDGFLDFYLGTGEPDISVLLPNLMFVNAAGKQFIDVTMAGGFGHLQKGHAIAFADFDEDGDQDIFEQMGGAKRVDAYRDALFENPGFGNHWLKVKLIGTLSNRFGVGARVHARVVDRNQQRSIYRHISSGGSFGANPHRAHLGIGKATSIRRLEVYWPATDKTQVFENIPANQFIEITEGRDQYRVIAGQTSPISPSEEY